MVFLYNRLGDCLSFSSAGWEEVLANASIYGWKAVGTLPPPGRFDPDSSGSESVTWDGNYSRPVGQTVLPADAVALAAAVERALTLRAPWKVNPASVLRDLTSFCQQRGFLVSSQLFINPSVLAPQTTPDSLKMAS